MTYNYNHVVIFYLPGSAGNFLGRCLNLLESVNCFLDQKTKILPRTLDEKIKLLSYCDVENRVSLKNDWISFEEKLLQLRQVNGLYKQIPHKEYLVQIKHPDSNIPYKKVLVETNRNFLIYIDPTDAHEWYFLNCFYKNSLLGAHWLLGAVEVAKDNSVFKVSLKNIITGVDTFWNEFVKLCEYIDHPISNIEEQAVKQLYNQWIKTTLPESRFKEFKNLLGLDSLIP